MTQVPSTKDNELGALWERSGKAGKYMTGTIVVNDVATQIVVFANKKTKDGQPDWRILRSIPKDPATSKPQEEASQEVVEEINPDDIPF